MRAKWFTNDELTCKCGCGGMPEPSFVRWLDAVREDLGMPMHVTSGYRCESYNRTIGGADDSQHVKGLAADIKCPSASYRFLLLQSAVKQGARGIGNYDLARGGFMHLDRRSGVPVSWVN